MRSLLLALVAAPTFAADPDLARLETQFRANVQPFLTTYCLGCHSKAKAKGGLDLSQFTSADLAAKDFNRWETVVDQLHAGSMPPDKAEQPKDEQRRQVIAWAREVRRYEGKRTAGDPGPVPARRLSNAEYDNTVRDLTGQDIRP